MNKTVGIKFWDNKKPFSLHVDNMTIQMAEYTKFLGVYIDYKLNWHIHITNLLDRLNTNRCMLSLGRNLLDMTCLRNVYYGHIHSHILYGISVWGSMASQCMINEIYKIQKQCVCITRPAAQLRDILSIFKDLRMMTVHNMIQIAMCKLGHNISHKHFPTPIVSLFDKCGGHQSHQYLLETSIYLTSNDIKSEQYRNSYLCRSIFEFNKLPMHLKNISKTSIFLNQLQKYVLED